MFRSSKEGRLEQPHAAERSLRVKPGIFTGKDGPVPRSRATTLINGSRTGTGRVQRGRRRRPRSCWDQMQHL